ncbi:hypothetical protein HYX58_04335 [Candidatus Dependentiae bacterium]|nr:hypothetical protein [Candidatus Dependentiae bacterium]
MIAKKGMVIIFFILLLGCDAQTYCVAKYSRWNLLLLPTYSLAILVGVVGGEIAGAAFAGSFMGIDRLSIMLSQRDSGNFLVRPDISLPKDVAKLVQDYSKNIDEIKSQELTGAFGKKTYKFSQRYSSIFYTVKNRGIISGSVKNREFKPDKIVFKKSKIVDHPWTKRAIVTGFIIAGIGIGCSKALNGT